MTNAKKPLVGPVLENRVPEFVKSDYKAFDRFLKDYLAWLEQDENFVGVLNAWRHNTDPTENVDQYIDAILRDAGFYLEKTPKVRKSTLLHLLKDFYLSRGSAQSFNLLFRAFFNEDIKIQYPRDRMLWLSDANYGKTNYIFLESTHKGTPEYNFIMDNVVEIAATATGSLSKVTAFVENISVVQSSAGEYLKIQIQRPLGEFSLTDLVTLQAGDVWIQEHIMKVLDLQIVNPGHGYLPGDRVRVQGATISGICEVDQTLKGGITSVNINWGGLQGYKVGDMIRAVPGFGGSGFSARVTKIGENPWGDLELPGDGPWGGLFLIGGGPIEEVELLSKGYGYEQTPNLYVQDRTNAFGASIGAESTEIGQILSLKFSEPFIGDGGDVKVTWIDTINGYGAELKPIWKTRYQTEGWLDDRGFLGQRSTLVDSNKYQQFSYETVSGINSLEYKGMIDELLHPVGFLRFSIVEIESNVSLNNVSASIEATQSLSLEYTVHLDLTYSMETEHTEAGNTITWDENGTQVTLVDENGNQIIWA